MTKSALAIASPSRTERILPDEFAGRTTLTVEETAKVIGISRASAYAAVKDRTLPAVKIGRRLLVARAALEKFLTQPC